MFRNSKLFILLALMAFFVLAGCEQDPGGDLIVDQEVIEMQDLDSAEVEITLGAGNLQVTSDTQNLMTAEFTYNLETWEPDVELQVNTIGDQQVGMLKISQPAALNFDPDLSDGRYDWDIQLTDQLPINLDVNVGAGSANLDLSQLSLTRLEITSGAGQLDVDLSGNNYVGEVEARIQGGVGELNIILPADTGVRVNLTGGLGNVTALGLTQEGDFYVNEAYGTAANNLLIDIEGGIGRIDMRVQE